MNSLQSLSALAVTGIEGCAFSNPQKDVVLCILTRVGGVRTSRRHDSDRKT